MLILLKLQSKMWQHDLDSLSFCIDYSEGTEVRKEERTSSLKLNTVHACVLMPNSQLDVLCIGCHCEKLSFLPLSGAHLQAYVRMYAHTQTDTNTFKNVHEYTHRYTPLVKNQHRSRVIHLYVSSPLSLNFKGFIILCVNTRAVLQPLQINSNPKMNSTSPPTQPKAMT